MLALLEGEADELGHNVLRALDLPAFEGQHGIESRVVVFDERLRHFVCVHFRPLFARLSGPGQEDGGEMKEGQGT